MLPPPQCHLSKADKTFFYIKRENETKNIRHTIGEREKRRREKERERNG